MLLASVAEARFLSRSEAIGPRLGRAVFRSRAGSTPASAKAQFSVQIKNIFHRSRYENHYIRKP